MSLERKKIGVRKGRSHTTVDSTHPFSLLCKPVVSVCACLLYPAAPATYILVCEKFSDMVNLALALHDSYVMYAVTRVEERCNM